jgi:hypothetical protein
MADAVIAEFAKPTNAMIDAAYEAVRFDEAWAINSRRDFVKAVKATRAGQPHPHITATRWVPDRQARPARGFACRHEIGREGMWVSERGMSTEKPQAMRTGRKNPGRHDTQRAPSSEMPPPGTSVGIMSE